MSQEQQKIGLITAIIIGMNGMIGSGIFTFPAVFASNVGPAGILAFLFVIFSVWAVSFSLSYLARDYPEEGSFYTYTKQWAGNIGGFIATSL